MSDEENQQTVQETNEEQESQQTETACKQKEPEISVGDLKYLVALSLAHDGVNDCHKVKLDDAKTVIDLITRRCPKPAEQKEPEISVGDLKYLVALSLAHDGVNDCHKVKLDDAKTVIDLITRRCPKPAKPTPSLKVVIDNKEHQRFMDYGLGRGVDATKPYPWQSKSSIQARKVVNDCENIIGTEGSGQREYYEEEVSSVLTQQFNTNLSIEEPSNSLVIGIYAEHSRSFAETRKAVGHKVMTRTVSFQTDYDDDFEEQLSEWILERIQTRRMLGMDVGKDLMELPDKQKDNKQDNKQKGNKTRLEMYITTCPKNGAYEEMRAILQHCYEYIERLGITHYIHTIKLGAAQYEVLTQKTYDSKYTATPSFEVNKVAKAVVSAHIGTNHQDKTKNKKVNSIGKIDKDFMVKRQPPDEAVLEIELKPLHSLVHMRALHLALKWALSRYIRCREARKEGPSLIACGPDKDGVTVYWSVKDNEVRGTTDIKEASLFYILKTEDGKHPHEFYIGYVGDDVWAQVHPNPMSKSQVLAPAPHYLTADLKTTGWTNEPLGVTAGTHRGRARFMLHNSAVRKYAFTRTPIDSDKWAEGGGYFINCARRSFRLDGYVAMVRKDKQQQIEEGIEMQEQETDLGAGGIQQQQEVGGARGGAKKGPYTYRTACMTSVKSHKNDWPWMVFRLLPGWHKTDLKEMSLGGPEPMDRSEIENPITHKSDVRDFLFLFGDLSTSIKKLTETPSAQAVKVKQFAQQLT